MPGEKELTKDFMSIPVEIISLDDGSRVSWAVRETYVDIYMQITITITCSTCKILLVNVHFNIIYIIIFLQTWKNKSVSVSLQLSTAIGNHINLTGRKKDKEFTSDISFQTLHFIIIA